MVDGTRSNIVHLLQRRSRATVEELSQALGLAAATVRRHLDILQRDGLVTYEPVQKKAGRPEYAYFLSEAGQEALPKEYGRLLGLLLREMRDVPPAETTNPNGDEPLAERLFSRIARRVASEHEHNGDYPTDDSPSWRVEQAFKALERETFSPEVEECEDGTRFRLRNCPFRSVALEDPAVCAYDAYLISRLTGSPVVREQSITNGAPCCVYRVCNDNDKT